MLSLLGYTVYLAMSFLMPHLEELLQTYSAGLIGTITLLMAVFLPLAYVTRRLFRSKLLQLNQFGRRYQKVEGYFPWFSVLDPWRLYSGRPPLHGDVVSKSAGAAPVPLPLHHPAWPSDPIPVPAVSGRLL